MLVRAAEESFDQGMTALSDGRHREALAYFEAAISLEKQYGVPRPQARYLSQYGLCLGALTAHRAEGIRFCREAAAIEEYNPDLHLNLGRALMLSGRRAEAFRALTRGLAMQPNHGAIVGELKKLGLRRRPVLPFLSRGNPVNVFLGRLRVR